MIDMSTQTTTLLPPERESDIETLAREANLPVAAVDEIYRIEHAKLDREAKIKTYVPVLIRRRVKELLQTRRSQLSIDFSIQPPV